MEISRLLTEAGKEWDVFTKGPIPSIFVGNATCGRSAGSVEVLEKFRAETVILWRLAVLACAISNRWPESTSLVILQ
jgi:hypothetical protein